MTTSRSTTAPADNCAMNRRRFIGYFSAAGLGASLMPGALAAVAKDTRTITPEMVKKASVIAGLELPAEDMTVIAESLNDWKLGDKYTNIRMFELDNSIPPALVFNPVPAGMTLPAKRLPVTTAEHSLSIPESDEELAFLPVTHLSHLIKTRQIRSTELTKLYLSRLKKYDPQLYCVITLTEELALKQARRADEEIAAGTYRGPLHGIPWGAKDLFAVKGYRTTWGASPYRDQVIDADATVYTRLTEAGAVLVAKLSMGALAMDNRWFGGKTRNPWNTKESSSGSSAGPGAATAAGLVGFSIGTETRGSIISPSSRCGVSGLRPSYGRVSRYGAMALAWSMDKAGPMCRSAEDCALVFDAIYGPDGKDTSVLDIPFNWDATADARSLRVGYVKPDTEREMPSDTERAQRVRESRERDDEALTVIRSLGVDLVPFEIPPVPSDDLEFILFTEASAAFDALTRSGRDVTMRDEPETSEWPELFRMSRFVPAVEYIQANRLRTRVIREFNEAMADIDLYIGSNLGLTNLTGHPEISIPHGFYSTGTPTSLRFTGKLFGEPEILLLAKAFQDATDHHLKHPRL